MGNQLEKEYNIKTKPMKLAGTYDFLRFIDHPSQPDKSLIIMKPPHKIGVIKDSSVILPIISIKQLSSCTVAICPKSIPLVLLKPQSQAQLKIIIYKLIKNGTQLGRCFFSQGRITIWAEQKRGYGGMSPQQFQNSKISERSSVFTAGIAVANYLNCIYEKSKKSQKGQKNKPKVESLISSAMKKDKQETQLLFDPKDRKQYTDMLKNLPKKLKSSHFWDSLSDSMQNLLCMMLQVDKNNRIDKKALLFSSDFMDQKQLLLYITIADDLQNMQKQSAFLFVEVLQFLIGQEKLIQKRLLEQYFIPVMMKLLAQSPLLIASCLIEVPNPPTKQIYVLFRKCPSKCQPIFRLVLRKRSKLHKIMSQDQYNGSVSRITFCRQEH